MFLKYYVYRSTYKLNLNFYDTIGIEHENLNFQL